MKVNEFPIPMCTIHPEKRHILEINEAFSALLGYNKEIIGEEFLVFVDPRFFSVALTIFDAVSSGVVYLSFPLLHKTGLTVMGSHAFSIKNEVIVDIILPQPHQTHSQMEHMLLENLSRPVMCIDSSGKHMYANQASQKVYSLKEEELLFSQEDWLKIKTLLEKKQPFSQWIKLGPKEDLFFFLPIDQNCWLLEYRWGKQEMLLRLEEIMVTWDVPAFIIDNQEEEKKCLWWNEKFVSLSSSPEALFQEIWNTQKKESILTLLHPHKGFEYYKVLFLPLHPQLTLLLGVLINETNYIRKEIIYQRLQKALEDMLHFTEDLHIRFHRGIEAFLETYKLSEREKKLVQLIQKGLSNEEIARNLFVSVDTVKKNVSQLYRKLSVSNRLELLQLLYLPNFRKTPQKG